MKIEAYKELVDKIGLSNLNEPNKETYNIVKEGSNNFTDQSLWNEMLADTDIKEAYELHLKALENMAHSENKPAPVAKKKQPSTRSKKSRNQVKVKIEPVKPEPVEVRKPAKRKATKLVKRTVDKKSVKFPVTVKRFSKEIQLIRRMINMDGKRKGVKSLSLLQRDLKSALTIQSDRKPVLREMSSRITGALKKAKDAGITDIDVTIDKDFKEKLLKNNNPAPKLNVQYLSGPSKKKKVKKAKAKKKGSKKKSRKVPTFITEWPMHSYSSNALGDITPQSPLPMSTRTSVVPRKTESVIPSDTLNDGLFQNLDQIDKNVKETFRLPGHLGEFFGDLERYKLAITLEGDQGGGKTQLAFQLADAFADIGENIGFFQLEVGAESNIMVRNRDMYIKPENRHRVSISGSAPKGIATIREYAKRFGVVIIDSWTKLDVDSNEFDKLRNDFPDTIWIVLFQRTSGKQIRGGTKPLYDAGANIEVHKVDNTFVNNYAEASKNRYGQAGLKYNIFRRELILEAA